MEVFQDIFYVRKTIEAQSYKIVFLTQSLFFSQSKT